MRKLNFCAAPILTLGLVACGGQDAAEPWNEAITTSQSWETLQPKAALTTEEAVPDVPVTDLNEAIGNQEFACKITRTSLKTSPEDFVYSKGALAELGVRKRAPIRVTIDLLRGDNWREVETPSLATVQSAIGELVDLAVKDGHEASATASFKSSEIHSSEQAMLEMGIAGEYMGSSASASFEGSRSASESAYMATLIQRAFTVSIEHPTLPADVLSADFNPRDLEALKTSGALEGDNPPLYISSITYGRVLIYSMRSEDEARKVKAAIEASYRGAASVDGYAKGEIEQTLRQADIEIAAIGGKQENIEALIRSGDLKDYFGENTQLTSMVPISFELRRLSDGQIAHITRTTEYDVKTCQNVTKPIGEAVTFTLRSVKINNDCEPGPNKGEIFGSFTLQWADQNGNLTRSEITSIARNSAKKVQSGNSLSVNTSVEVERYPGQAFKLVGRLSEADEGLKGKDDTVGVWNTNLAGRDQGDSSAKGTGHCISGSNNRPVAHFSIEKTDDIYP